MVLTVPDDLFIEWAKIAYLTFSFRS
jgi:hypothetical protein